MNGSNLVESMILINHVNEALKQAKAHIKKAVRSFNTFHQNKLLGFVIIQ